MKLRELTIKNAGFVCGVFREKYLKENQKRFSDRHGISPAGVSYFERGVSMSFYSFLSYIQDGLGEYLEYIDTDTVNAMISESIVRQRKIRSSNVEKAIKA